jgi:hypothetical protein
VGTNVFHGGFHVSLLISALWIAKPDLEAMMELEPGKHLALPYLIPDPPAYAGGVIEDNENRDSPYVIEDCQQTLADTFCSFPFEKLAEDPVAEGEGEHQEVEFFQLSLD